nr:hypothetical protein [uncultured Acetatifactor sp.]
MWDVGPVAGTDHYATFDMEALGKGTDYRYFLTERDETEGTLLYADQEGCTALGCPERSRSCSTAGPIMES